MKIVSTKTAIVISSIIFVISVSEFIHCSNASSGQPPKTENEKQDATTANAIRMLEEGKQTFRYETFGDEAWWTDALQLNKAIAGAKNDGVGEGLSP